MLDLHVVYVKHRESTVLDLHVVSFKNRESTVFYLHTVHAKHRESTVLDLHVVSIRHRELIGPRRKKSCLRRFANNTGADQPAHPRSLISAFVIRFLESIICKLATGEISIF